MRILISGAGIAGPTLAYWLNRYGMQPTLVEKAPRLRSGGYMIDFWGAGFEIADRMELLPRIKPKGYIIKELRVVNRRGKRISGFPVDVFNRVTAGRFISLPRGDLAASIYELLEGKVETICGDSVVRIEQTKQGVHVVFESGAEGDFDLVVGAGGLHSRIRELVFGPQSRFEKYLGCKVAAFEVAGYQPRDELVYVLYTEVGQQVVRFTMRGDRTLFLFTFADDAVAGPNDLPSQKTLLRKRFGNSGWECPRILDALDAADDLYFDRVSQIRMEEQQGLWSCGRVTLVGDAASCVSLLAGQGTALAMVAAYILAGELKRANGNYAEAFARYQSLFAPFVRAKQEAALRLASFFAPRSSFSLFLRNQVMKLLGVSWIGDRTAVRDLADRIALPDYS